MRFAGRLLLAIGAFVYLVGRGETYAVHPIEAQRRPVFISLSQR